MCSNQNYSHSLEKICRVFVVVDQEDSQLRRFQINIAQFLDSSYVNLSNIFKLMADKGLTLNSKRFYLPVLNLVYQSEMEDITVPLCSLSERVIKVIQQSTSDYTLSQHRSQPMEQPQPTKRQKQPERVLRSVLENVKLWRHLHTKNKKLSLTEAAKLIGISKKTLDDYFLQLRLGELYGFPFQDNLDQKVGVLRAHIRKHEQKELETRLPKEIRSFEWVRDVEELEEEMLQDSPEKMHQTSNTADPEDNISEALVEIRGLI